MKSYKIKVMSASQAWQLKKPRYNGYACGHGVHGDTKYNRRKDKQELERRCNEYY